MPANRWDAGARQEPDPRDHPLHGLWVDGRPAALASPERQNAAVLTQLLDGAARQRPQGRWRV
jgi:hypothetical protein